MKNTTEILSFLLLAAGASYGATGITAITTTTQTGASSSATLDNSDVITFDGVNTVLTSITSGGSTFDRVSLFDATSFGVAGPTNLQVEYIRTAANTEGAHQGTQITNLLDTFNGGLLNIAANNPINSGGVLNFSGSSISVGTADALSGAGFSIFDRGNGDSITITINGISATAALADYGSNLTPFSTARDRYQGSSVTDLFDSDISNDNQGILGTFIPLSEFTGLAVGDTISDFTLETGSGLDLVDVSFVLRNDLDFNTVFVPEPTSVSLLGLSVLGLLARRRR